MSAEILRFPAPQEPLLPCDHEPLVEPIPLPVRSVGWEMTLRARGMTNIADGIAEMRNRHARLLELAIRLRDDNANLRTYL